MISVAMATYNGEKYIYKQLESIKNQSLAVEEVIICDDCSTDNTYSIIKHYIEINNLKHWRVFCNEKNIGFASNFFNALYKCSGDIIFTADQDDIWLDDKVKEILSVYESNTNISLIASSYSLIDENDDPIANFIPHHQINNDGSISEMSISSFIGSSPIRGCSLSFKKSILENIPALELQHLLGHDWLLCIMAFSKGTPVIYNKILFKYRIHSSNLSLNFSTAKQMNDVNKRVLGLQEAISAYNFLKSIVPKKEILWIDKQIMFDKKRLSWLQNKNFISLVYVTFHMAKYYKIHGTYKGMIRVYIGDILYAIKK